MPRKCKEFFNEPRFTGSVRQTLVDYPDWIEDFKKSPAAVLNHVLGKHPNLRAFKRANIFDVHVILSNEAEKLQPGKCIFIIIVESVLFLNAKRYS